MISVIFATYNEDKKYLLSSLNSILNQSYTNFEIIIVLEPNDLNKNLLSEMSRKDNRIKLFVNKEKEGLSKSLNSAISHAKGEILARMDSDDISHKNRFEIQLNAMLKKKLDIVSSDCNLIDFQNNFVGVRKYSENSVKKNFIFRNGICHPSVLMKKSIVEKYGNYNEDFLMSEDLELWLRYLSNNVRIGYVDKTLLDYRTKKKCVSSKIKLEL